MFYKQRSIDNKTRIELYTQKTKLLYHLNYLKIMKSLHLASWRWSRLKKASAYKRLFMVDKLYWLFMVIMVLVLGTFLSEPDILGMMKWLFYFACFLLVFDVLYIICAADDYIYISENVGSVYIYKNPSGYYIMEKVLKQEHDFWYINSYEIITSTYKHSALLYELSENKQWYYLTGKSKKPFYLGNRVGNTIFETLKKGGKKELRILCEDTYTTFCVDAYNCKNIYVSPFYSDKIMQVNRSDIIEKWLGPTTIPEQYLVIRNNGLYDVFGLYYKQEYGPSWMELAIPVVLLKDGANHVVLKYQH